ncbi:Type III restriction-modification system methylation subunit [Desulfosporosinus sp. I2]|uniref:site-specific DNA-methyltransferase n=1 Tax=Desulfosporosinus sp. I2 TaxID=1617025 RepID=UPI0005EF0A2E|nr:site-specific DNA-methyltransferase [Desulfosporosinus sp. I2]KJR46483.1 Type III restriction-modification system methylation subunit [Desulfosporosinus sp. I2]
MPTLEWIGKDKVVNHHLDVPYRLLEYRYAYTEKGISDDETLSDNKIIRGDNLEALKALLPQYEGRVKCIYIDPPYNTGNEGWAYNDNVNDPKIKKWLGQVVGREGEDLSRHDKWLCMMYPRIKLLQRLLADDGVIFVSIDDIEITYLRLIMDEIFGKKRFISQFIWKSRQNKDNRNKTNVSIDHEYILCYGNQLRGCHRDLSQYSNPDNDPRELWTSANMVGLATAQERPNLHYDLINPETGINYGKPLKGWRYDKNTMHRLITENRILWPSSPNGRPRKKQFLNDLATEYTGFSSIVGNKCYTSDGTKEQLSIFGNVQVAFPKCTKLLEELLVQATEKDSIVLDSFAGSGTTAHAVLNLNKQDGGNRKFILIEMMDYADSITAERVKRVINGYADVEGTGSNFNFYDLGHPLLLDNQYINEEVPVQKIREYLFFTETKQPIEKQIVTEEPYLLGIHNHAAYYFYYEKPKVTVLNHDFLSRMKTRAECYVIYADKNTLSDSELEKYYITFKKIPRDITRL